MNQKKTALFSVPVHAEMHSFAQGLIKAGWMIIATSDTHNFLKENGIDSIDVSEFTGIKEDYGFPPTLHPKMEAALTTDFDDRIDLVYDLPYGTDVGNDVGGRTLLALAAKGNRIPVMNPEDMKRVVGEIMKKGKVSKDFAKYLRDKANYEASDHYIKLASNNKDFLGVIGSKFRVLKEGENMYQLPAILFKSDDDPLGICNFKQVAGNPPCFTNTADLDSVLDTICKLQSSLTLNGITNAYVTVAAKHGNACGIGVTLKNPSEALDKALWGNAKGIWGGEVITNFPIDEALAEILKKSDKREKLFGIGSWMLDVIAAPKITDDAVRILSSNPNRKLFVNKALLLPSLRKEENLIRQVRGGFISQPPADYLLDLNKVEWTYKTKELGNISLIIAWSAAFTSFRGGNETAIAKDGKLLSVGGGPSTYDAVITAIARAKEYRHDIKGAFFGADAFFPFSDVPELLFESGCIGGTVPAGGKREKDVVKYFKDNKICVGLIPEQYRGFCRH